MRFLAALIGAIVAALLVAWLINSPRGATKIAPPPAVAPASSPSKVADTPPPVTEPEPAPKPASAPPLPQLPPYLEIVDSLAGVTPKIDSTLTSPNAIDLTTAGVRRIRLLRSQWPRRVTTSIAVRIDGQGIEWTGKRDVLELERSDNGDWAIRSPATPVRP
jgi:hypothetical protein